MPSLQTICKIIRESWSKNPFSRLNALRIKKSLINLMSTTTTTLTNVNNSNNNEWYGLLFYEYITKTNETKKTNDKITTIKLQSNLSKIKVKLKRLILNLKFYKFKEHQTNYQLWRISF